MQRIVVIVALTALVILPAGRADAAAPACGWSIVTGANAHGSLAGVAAISPTDVWAVGETMSQLAVRAFAEHWDGSRSRRRAA